MAQGVVRSTRVAMTENSRVPCPCCRADLENEGFFRATGRDDVTDDLKAVLIVHARQVGQVIVGQIGFIAQVLGDGHGVSRADQQRIALGDRKSTRLNSSH